WRFPRDPTLLNTSGTSETKERADTRRPREDLPRNRWWHDGDKGLGYHFCGCWCCLLDLAWRPWRFVIPFPARQRPRERDNRGAVLRWSRNPILHPTTGRQKAVACA